MEMHGNNEEIWKLWQDIEPPLSRYCKHRWNGSGEDILSETNLLFVDKYVGGYTHRQAVYFGKLKAREAARNMGHYKKIVSLDEIIGSEMEPYEPEADFMADYERKEKKEIISKALSQLSETHRRIVSLRYFEERTLAETAEIMEMSLAGIHRQEKDAFRVLRRLLKSLNQDPFAMNKSNER